MTDYLPDSRTLHRAGSTWSDFWGCNIIPVFCANCGKQHGWVPERNMTAAFVLCKKCEHWGNLAHFYQERESVFWERIENERKEALATQSTTLAETNPAEWIRRQLENPSSPLSRLARDYDAYYRRVAS